MILWYLANADMVPAPIRNPDDMRLSTAMLGYADCGGEAFVVDMAVMSEQIFYKHLRTLAPVLEGVGAKLVVVNEEGVMQYFCGYKFEPID